MKVLFVNPPTTTCLETIETGKQYIEENIGNRFFPLSKIPFEVMYKLNEIQDIEKEIVLLDYEWYKNSNLSKKNLLEIVINKNPDIILTTLISQASADTLDWITTKLKEKLPNLIIIIGGQAITYLQEKIFKFCPNIDFAFIGNADIQLLELVKRLSEGKRNFENIKGLLFKKENKVLKNDLEEDNVITYSEEIYQPYESLLREMVEIVKNKNAEILCSEEFSKGCPYQCDFCAAKKKYQEKEISKIVSLLNYLCSIGMYKFYIEDLTFGVNKKHRRMVLKELKKLKKSYKEFGFRCVTRADIINEQFVKELLESGCYEIGIGIECNDENVINLMNKKIPISRNIESLNILGKSGISFKLFLIEGYAKSNTLTSKKTFEMLNYLEGKNYNYFIQPALSRDIIPSQQRFIEKEKQRVFKRGTVNQLDFRHDCRKEGWDTTRAISSICLLMLAYPSTELGKKNKDIDLQKRTLLNLPFPKDEVELIDIINFLKEIFIKSVNKDVISLRVDFAHYIDGIYTLEEIKDRLSKLYPDFDKEELNKEINYCLNELRKKGLIDSFGNPNLINMNKVQKKNKKYVGPKRKDNLLLFWNGLNKRYIYAPLNKKVIKIKTCFYKNISEDVFEFLICCKGFLSLEEISKRLYYLFKGRKGFKNLEKSKETTNQIYSICKNYGLCI